MPVRIDTASVGAFGKTSLDSDICAEISPIVDGEAGKRCFIQFCYKCKCL